MRAGYLMIIFRNHVIVYISCLPMRVHYYDVISNACMLLSHVILSLLLEKYSHCTIKFFDQLIIIHV